MPRRDEARQGYMFSTANAMPVESSRAAMPLTKSRGVLALPPERRVHDDHLGADLGGHLGGALELAPRLGAPDPLGEQQARRVHRADRHRVVLGELLDRRDLLAERVDADHHLDGVVAEAGGVREGVRGRLGVDRGRGQADRGVTASARPTELVEPLEDHALTQRPRADLQLGQVEDVHAGLGDQRAGHDLVGAARRDPGQVGELVRRHRDQLGDPLAQRRPAAACAAPARPRRRARRRRCGPASGTSWTWPPPGRERRRAAGCRRRGRSRRGSACAAAHASSSRGAVVEEAARQPGRAQRQRPGDVGRLVGAARDLQRAAADVEDRQPPGRPAEPAAYGEEGQPGLVLAGEHLDVARRCASRTWSSTASELTASRTAEVANASISSQPLSSATTQRLGGERRSARRSRSGAPRRPRRGARPGAAAACRSTPAAAPRRRGRRPPAGGRCWSRCRGRPGAWRPTYRPAAVRT